jgi:hypothetical protein
MKPKAITKIRYEFDFNKLAAYSSKLSTRVIIAQIMLERIIAESADPLARGLALNGLEAMRICKEDENRAQSLVKGKK